MCYLVLLVAADGEHLARQRAGWPVALVASGTVVGTGVGVIPRARARPRLVRSYEISDVAWVKLFVNALKLVVNLGNLFSAQRFSLLNGTLFLAAAVNFPFPLVQSGDGGTKKSTTQRGRERERERET